MVSVARTLEVPRETEQPAERENGMHMHAVRGKVQPGKADEFAEKWHDIYGVRFPEIAGFVRASFSADRETDMWLAVSVWSAPPDEAQLSRAIQELGAQVAALLAGPPTSEWYEVLQEI